MQDYYKVNVRKFLKESKTWEGKISELKKQLRNAGNAQTDMFDENHDVDYELQEQNEAIEREIAKYEEYINLKTKAVALVSQEELDCLEVFFGQLEERGEVADTDDGSQLKITAEKKKDDPFKNEHTNEEPLNSIQEAMEKYGYGSKQAVYDRYYHGRDKIADCLNSPLYFNSLIDYYHFDVNSFLKDAHTWKGKIKERQSLLSYDKSLRSIRTDSVGGRQIGRKSDPTLQEVLENEKIHAQIEKYENYMKVLQNATDTLDDLERDLIYSMFLPEGNKKYISKGVRIENIALKHYVSITVAERTLRTAKNRVRDYVEKRYFGRKKHD